MTRYARRWIAAVLCCLLAAAPAIAADPAALSPEVSRVVQEYLAKVAGRFGALAVSTDGTKVAYYICQSHLWKNCDDYELNDRFVSVPSSRLAAQKALGRCGGSCVVLYVNETRVSPTSSVPAIR